MLNYTAETPPSQVKKTKKEKLFAKSGKTAFSACFFPFLKYNTEPDALMECLFLLTGPVDRRKHSMKTARILKYDFGPAGQAGNAQTEHYLICPGCGEHLRQMDIENFSCCPFCDQPLERNEQLEDFILEPVVDNWIRAQEMGNVPAGSEPFSR